MLTVTIVLSHWILLYCFLSVWLYWWFLGEIGSRW